MEIGVIYPQNALGGDPEAVRAIGLATERLGFDHLVAYDHVIGATHDRLPALKGPYTQNDPFHDPFAIFAYLSAITTQIQFVTGILILPQRQTALVARQAADVDLLSHGRLTLGVGIGWNYVEYDALGEDFSRRGKRIGEQIELLRKLWTEPLVDFSGEFDRIDRAALNPRPKRQIPVWCGGFADVALQRAAAIGDGFIAADGAADAFEQASRLRELLQENGRDPASFGLQCNMLRAKTPEDVAATATRWRDIGGTRAAVNTMGLGLENSDAHVEYMEKVAGVLRSEGLI